MKRVVRVVLIGVLLCVNGVAWAHEEHEHESTSSNVQMLKGEVVDVFCYLSHGKEGLGKDHAGCAKHCIKSGLPVAIKVGDTLYLASMADHTAANEKLADLAGQQVEVHGTLLEADGQHLIAITEVEKAE